MTTLENAARKDWNIISGKVNNLRSVSNLATTKKYLIKDIEACITNYNKKYEAYDPLNPPK